MTRVVLIGDHKGLTQLLRHVPKNSIVAICAASIRPSDLSNCISLAKQHSLELLIQPRRDRDGYTKFVDRVRQLKVDLAIVNSYSMILPEDLLREFSQGGFNVHGSLLPRNRGANPIQWALIKGEKVTGVTLHRIEKTVDSGAIVSQRKVKIRFWDSWITVTQKIFREAEILIQEGIPVILSGRFHATPQVESQSSINVRRTSRDSEFSWADPIIGIYRLHKAVLPPHPPAYAINRNGKVTYLDRKFSFLSVFLLVSVKRTQIVLRKVFFKGK